jgi:hypothetical protein
MTERERLPNLRPRAAAFKFRVGEGEGFVHVGEYADGRPGEVFLRMAKQGSTLAGLTEALGVAVSVALQHGVSLHTLVSQFVNLRFDPSGQTDDVEVPLATSIVDYVFRRLALDYLDGRAQPLDDNHGARRHRLPARRPGVRALKFTVGDGKGFAHVGEYADGQPGELFIRMAKQGSTMAGLTESLGIAVSVGLQHGVPLATFVKQFINLRFEPAGVTGDAEIRLATSILDYLFRRLAIDYLTFAERAELGVFTIAERQDLG